MSKKLPCKSVSDISEAGPALRCVSDVLKQKLENAKRVAVLGIGSELRGDDVAGILTAQQIEKSTKNKSKSPRSTRPDKSGLAQGKPEVRVFIGDTAPENLTGEIKRYQPTHLIIIDSADLDIEPGEIRLINPEDIGGTSFCTHMLPTKVLTDYLMQSFKFELIAIGIQPKTLTFGSKPTKKVLTTTKKLADTIVKLLK